MRGVGPKMCFFIDLPQLRDFMPTLVKRMHTFIQSTRKGGTRAPLAMPLMLALTLLAHKIQNTAKFCLRHQQRKIPKMWVVETLPTSFSGTKRFSDRTEYSLLLPEFYN